ncbi:hypothetical protein FNV43_RR02046 [Rhamnella rubrinervis]|uniref:Uncharacterized protein n=1 Tax=Rhamnella rubrinervis TaxID=2594499 RepID=A0A8K0HS41_9ROSA|nr:hypothetical protein FNV43_RR02046 [Rhamnella rubrinervis]
MLKRVKNSTIESLLLYMENLNMIKVFNLHCSIVNEYKVENNELRKENTFLCQTIEEFKDIVTNEFANRVLKDDDDDEDLVKDDDDG